MGLFSGIRRTGRFFFSPSRWFDSDRMKRHTQSLSRVGRFFLNAQSARYTETFEESIKRQALTEQDIKARQKEFLFIALFMALFSFLVLCYSGYLLWLGAVRGLVVSLAVFGLAATVTFRYHFWYFQIKKRKLGCTFKEWWQEGVLGGKS